MKKLLIYISFIWELPQNILGFFLFTFMKIFKIKLSIEYKGSRMFIESPVAISLGCFVFWNTDYENEIFILTKVNKKHEYGHSVQSIILGPLYLPVIGISSSFRTFYARYYHYKTRHKWMGYYKGFPENWADYLGKVDSTTGKEFT